MSQQRARYRRIVALAGGVLAAALAVFAINRVDVANSARARQENIARSKQLAAEALRSIPFDIPKARQTAALANQAAATPEAADASSQVAMLRAAIDAKIEVGPVKQIGFLNNSIIAALGMSNQPQDKTEAGSGARIWVPCANPTDAATSPRIF